MDITKINIDISLYNGITEEDILHIYNNLDIESFRPLGLSIEKWDGSGFNGLSPELIKEHHGSDFYLVKNNGNLLFIQSHDDITSLIDSSWASNITNKIEEMIQDKKKPVNPEDNSPEDINSLDKIIDKIDNNISQVNLALEEITPAVPQLLLSQAQMQETFNVTSEFNNQTLAQILLNNAEQMQQMKTQSNSQDTVLAGLLQTQAEVLSSIITENNELKTAIGGLTIMVAELQNNLTNKETNI